MELKKNQGSLVSVNNSKNGKTLIFVSLFLFTTTYFAIVPSGAQLELYTDYDYTVTDGTDHTDGNRYDPNLSTWSHGAPSTQLALNQNANIQFVMDSIRSTRRLGPEAITLIGTLADVAPNNEDKDFFRGVLDYYNDVQEADYLNRVDPQQNRQMRPLGDNEIKKILDRLEKYKSNLNAYGTPLYVNNQTTPRQQVNHEPSDSDVAIRDLLKSKMGKKALRYFTTTLKKVYGSVENRQEAIENAAILSVALYQVFSAVPDRAHKPSIGPTQLKLLEGFNLALANPHIFSVLFAHALYATPQRVLSTLDSSPYEESRSLLIAQAAREKATGKADLAIALELIENFITESLIPECKEWHPRNRAFLQRLITATNTTWTSKPDLRTQGASFILNIKNVPSNYRRDQNIQACQHLF